MNTSGSKQDGSTTSPEDDGIFRIGETVLCEWDGKVYVAKILQIFRFAAGESPVVLGDGRYKKEEVEHLSFYVHYTGWQKKWDQFVTVSRLKKIPPDVVVRTKGPGLKGPVKVVKATDGSGKDTLRLLPDKVTKGSPGSKATVRAKAKGLVGMGRKGKEFVSAAGQDKNKAAGIKLKRKMRLNKESGCKAEKIVPSDINYKIHEDKNENIVEKQGPNKAMNSVATLKTKQNGYSCCPKRQKTDWISNYDADSEWESHSSTDAPVSYHQENFLNYRKNVPWILRNILFHDGEQTPIDNFPKKVSGISVINVLEDYYARYSTTESDVDVGTYIQAFADALRNELECLLYTNEMTRMKQLHEESKTCQSDLLSIIPPIHLLRIFYKPELLPRCSTSSHSHFLSFLKEKESVWKYFPQYMCLIYPLLVCLNRI